MIVPSSALRAPARALGSPVTGGHTRAHAPVQRELPGLSASNMYTVSRFGPYARIIPSLLSRLVVISATEVTPAEVPLVDEPYGPLAAADDDTVPALEPLARETALGLLAPPQPAASSIREISDAPILSFRNGSSFGPIDVMQEDAPDGRILPRPDACRADERDPEGRAAMAAPARRRRPLRPGGDGRQAPTVKTLGALPIGG
jgi:hypothetical protein